MNITRQLFKSLQFQLILWSVVLLLILAVVAGGYGFWSSYNEINDFQDDNLKNTAALLEQSLNINTLDNALRREDKKEAKDSLRHPFDDGVTTGSTFQNIHFDTDDDDGAITVDIVALSASSSDSPAKVVRNHQNNKKHDDSNPIPNSLLGQIPLGISDQKLDGHTWRTYRSDIRLLAANTNDAPEDVALILRQQTDLQDDLAKASAWQSFLPLVIGMGLLTLLLPFIMWRMFKPVRQLHDEMNNRHENDLSPLTIDNLPSELMPLAQSMNKLLKLVQISIEQQQRFIADAAHELRSPLTAISLQLQRLQRQNTDKLSAEGLDKLALRLKRNQNLVEQLLTLARAGNIETAIGAEHAQSSVKQVVEQVISLLIPIADSKDIMLTAELADAGLVPIDETSLLLVIKNLIQNAIVYTPSHGQVAIKLFRLEADSLHPICDFGTPVLKAKSVNNQRKGDLNQRLVLQIMDSGKGIDPNNYDKAFEPFVRLPQSGSDASHDGGFANRSDSVSGKIANVEGTGLGLSIVKTVCLQAGIDVFLQASPFNQANLQDENWNNKGLCVTLVFWL